MGCSYMFYKYTLPSFCTQKYGVSVLRLGIPEIIDLCSYTTHTTGERHGADREHKMHFSLDTRKCLPNHLKGVRYPAVIC